MKAIKCSICGKVHTDTLDVFYPLNRELTLWNIYCNLLDGGCGRIVEGVSKGAVLDKWERGVTDYWEEL